jgi:glucokinase
MPPAEIEDDATCAIGLDVGGTKIAAGLVTPSGRVLARRIFPTYPERGGKSVLDNTLVTARDLAQEAASRGREVLGIGVGVAELVDPDGNVTSSHTIAWRNLPIRESFSALAPSVVDSDVRTAARAEAAYGAGREFDPFLYVTIGTGISYCLVQGGRPYTGARGNAIVLSGAPPVGDVNISASPLSPSLLEDFAAGPALVYRYNCERHRPHSVARAEDVLAAAKAGDPHAAEVVKTAGAATGSCAGWLVNALDPASVLVGGGLGLAGGLYWSAMLASIRHHVWADASRSLPIVPAALRTDAGFLGAALASLEASDARDRRSS